jgi:hypothetical protein
MSRLRIIIGLAAVSLIAACAVGSRPAAPHGQATVPAASAHRIHQPAWSHAVRLPTHGGRLACGNSLSGEAGNGTRPRGPCTPLLPIPRASGRSRHGQSHAIYFSRPCWCAG